MIRDTEFRMKKSIKHFLDKLHFDLNSDLKQSPRTEGKVQRLLFYKPWGVLIWYKNMCILQSKVCIKYWLVLCP